MDILQKKNETKEGFYMQWMK